MNYNHRPTTGKTRTRTPSTSSTSNCSPDSMKNDDRSSSIPCPIRMFLSEALSSLDTTSTDTGSDVTPPPLYNTEVVRIMGHIVTIPSPCNYYPTSSTNAISSNGYHDGDNPTDYHHHRKQLSSPSSSSTPSLYSSDEMGRSTVNGKKQDDINTNSNSNNSTNNGGHHTFMMDDGTACIDVITSFQNDDVIMVEGECIDCIGTLRYVHLRPQHNKQQIRTRTPTPTRTIIESSSSVVKVPCFLVSTIAKVSDPNIEILRMAELSSRSMGENDGTSTSNHPPLHIQQQQQQQHNNNNHTKTKTTTIITRSPTRSSSSSSRPWSRIYMYGDIIPPDPPTEEEQRMKLSRWIRSSKPDGGVSERDLASLLGYDDDDNVVVGGGGGDDGDRRSMLRGWLEDMQSNCEIYQTRDGRYLPL